MLSKLLLLLFFEKIVLNLLVAMGYGGSIEDAASTTKRTGDDGIDGVIKEDRLGLDLIHIQAKRWKDTIVVDPRFKALLAALRVREVAKVCSSPQVVSLLTLVSTSLGLKEDHSD